MAPERRLSALRAAVQANDLITLMHTASRRLPTECHELQSPLIEINHRSMIDHLFIASVINTWPQEKFELSNGFYP